jgi:hypothetical protein
MQESDGKSAARSYFYTRCLPDWLTGEQLRAGNYLLLLGDTPRELELLDDLRVPRQRIWSVESAINIYRRQLGWNAGVSLHYGPVDEYLSDLLHSNQGFCTLNLDVEGTYLTNLDPAMTPVLLFCWRNPETIVGTYSTISRDAPVLYEGIRSLAIFLWLVPDLVQQVVVQGMAQYESAQYIRPFRMMLRDLFWIRSIMEHALVASATVGTTSCASVESIFTCMEMIWDSVAATREIPLTLQAIMTAVDVAQKDRAFQKVLSSSVAPTIGVALQATRDVVYKARHPWCQRCYFTKFVSLDDPMHYGEWLRETLQRVLAEPLISIDRTGVVNEIVARPVEPSLLDPTLTVCTNKNLFDKFVPRSVPFPKNTSQLASISSTVRSLQTRRSSATQ